MKEDHAQRRLTELKKKWLNKTITPEELVEFEAWYNADQNNQVPIPSDFASSEDEIAERMLERIKSKREPAKIPVIRRRYFKWVAAASIIGLVSFIGYNTLLRLPRDPAIQQSSLVRSDVQAGQDRAILQLADGTTIFLDSTANGIIQQQGNAELIKSGGALTYHTEKKQDMSPAVYNIMSTPRGGQYKLTLADGTMVWLNSGSRLRYPVSFLQNERIVELTGEAYFEVAKNARKPFRVRVGRLNVEVLGTHFNVNAYADEAEIKTTLLEGSVRVHIDDAHKAKLNPGEQARVATQGINNITLVRNVDIEQVTSWQKGIFQFRNADLSLIARQISRWYDVDVITRGNTGQIQLGGGISKKVPLSQILEVLETSGAKYKWENGKLIFYSP